MGHVAPPILCPQARQTANANVVLVSLPVLVSKMRQLHRFKYSVDDHCGPEPRAEAQKTHAAAFVASERLHSSVIDNLNWRPECLVEIKSDPAAAQVVWLVEGASMDYRPWIAYRDEAILPIFGDALHIAHHFTGGHVGS